MASTIQSHRTLASQCQWTQLCPDRLAGARLATATTLATTEPSSAEPTPITNVTNTPMCCRPGTPITSPTTIALTTSLTCMPDSLLAAFERWLWPPGARPLVPKHRPPKRGDPGGSGSILGIGWRSGPAEDSGRLDAFAQMR